MRTTFRTLPVKHSDGSIKAEVRLPVYALEDAEQGDRSTAIDEAGNVTDLSADQTPAAQGRTLNLITKPIKAEPISKPKKPASEDMPPVVITNRSIYAAIQVVELNLDFFRDMLLDMSPLSKKFIFDNKLPTKNVPLRYFFELISKLEDKEKADQSRNFKTKFTDALRLTKKNDRIATLKAIFTDGQDEHYAVAFLKALQKDQYIDKWYANVAQEEQIETRKAIATAQNAALTPELLATFAETDRNQAYLLVRRFPQYYMGREFPNGNDGNKFPAIACRDTPEEAAFQDLLKKNPELVQQILSHKDVAAAYKVINVALGYFTSKNFVTKKINGLSAIIDLEESKNFEGARNLLDKDSGLVKYLLAERNKAYHWLQEQKQARKPSEDTMSEAAPSTKKQSVVAPPASRKLSAVASVEAPVVPTKVNVDRATQKVNDAVNYAIIYNDYFCSEDFASEGKSDVLSLKKLATREGREALAMTLKQHPDLADKIYSAGLYGRAMHWYEGDATDDENRRFQARNFHYAKAASAKVDVNWDGYNFYPTTKAQAAVADEPAEAAAPSRPQLAVEVKQDEPPKEAQAAAANKPVVTAAPSRPQQPAPRPRNEVFGFVTGGDRRRVRTRQARLAQEQRTTEAQANLAQPNAQASEPSWLPGFLLNTFGSTAGAGLAAAGAAVSFIFGGGPIGLAIYAGAVGGILLIGAGISHLMKSNNKKAGNNSVAVPAAVSQEAVVSSNTGLTTSAQLLSPNVLGHGVPMVAKDGPSPVAPASEEPASASTLVAGHHEELLKTAVPVPALVQVAAEALHAPKTLGVFPGVENDPKSRIDLDPKADLTVTRQAVEPTPRRVSF